MMSTFIKAAEVWVLSEDGQLLEFGAGAYGPALQLASISKKMCFGRCEGLPGRAWEEGRPILLDHLDDSQFRRAAAANAAGLNCAVALPFFQRDKLKGVLVIFCGHSDGAAAMELWHNNMHIATDMTLVAGAYGPQGEAFKSISHDTSLPRGAGLPGQAWRRGEAIFMEDLGAKKNRFVRAELVAAAGLNRGLAIPTESLRAADLHVVTFLVGMQSPLAQRIERWVPDDSGTQLNCVYAFSEKKGAAVSTGEVPLSLALPAAGSVATAYFQGLPAINDKPATDPGPPGATAGWIEAIALIAIPVVWEGEVIEVVVLYL